MQGHMVLWRSQMPRSDDAARGGRSWATPGPRAGGGRLGPAAALAAIGLIAAPLLRMVWTGL